MLRASPLRASVSDDSLLLTVRRSHPECARTEPGQIVCGDCGSPFEQELHVEELRRGELMRFAIEGTEQERMLTLAYLTLPPARRLVRVAPRETTWATPKLAGDFFLAVERDHNALRGSDVWSLIEHRVWQKRREAFNALMAWNAQPAARFKAEAAVLRYARAVYGEDKLALPRNRRASYAEHRERERKERELRREQDIYRLAVGIGGRS